MIIYLIIICEQQSLLELLRNFPEKVKMIQQETE
jgi:hypothetical protein